MRSAGLRVVWVRGAREATGLKGKHGGPVIRQRVEKIYVPKEGVDA